MSNPLLDIGGALLRAGAPLVGGLLTTAATAAGGPIAGAAAGLALDALKGALGLGADASVTEVAAKMQADPVAAAAAAAQIEAAHGAAADELLSAHNGLNVAQSTSPDFFVAGPRPFLMWVCAAAVLHQALVAPVFSWFSTLAHLPAWPVVPEGVFSLVATLTGALFAVRGIEGALGTARESMSAPRGVRKAGK